MEIFQHEEFWVEVAFQLLIALFVYLKVPAMIVKSLDERAAAIAKSLADAEKLRLEAESLLKDYQRRHVEAEKEAESIVEQARREAEAYAAEARNKLKEMIERRSASARQKIAQAETQALKDVRAAAADMAVALATRVLKHELKGEQDQRLVDRSIDDLRDKLN